MRLITTEKNIRYYNPARNLFVLNTMTKASEKEKKSQEKRCVIFLNIIVSKYFPDIKKFKDIQDVQERKTSILNTFYGGID